jgi:drug/metabolite transporter (DMT)-like permease
VSQSAVFAKTWLANSLPRWLTRAVSSGKSNASLVSGLVLAIFFWGGNNVGAKWLVASWPPVFTGATRFLGAGLLLLLLLWCTRWLGDYEKPSRELDRALWLRGGLSLAAYIVAFNGALVFTAASHVALYLGAAPVWALIWESWKEKKSRSALHWLAAFLALCGVGVLLWPALAATSISLPGELLGLASSFLWTAYGHQSRNLAAHLNGAEVTAHTMWRAAVWLAPVTIYEVATRGLPVTGAMLGVQFYCVTLGGAVAFAIWNRTLGYWPSSRVLLFNNLIPISTMTWAYFFLREPITPTFIIAMILVVAGVVIGQIRSSN